LFAEPPGADLSEAVQAAGGYLMANHGASATMILPADMPLVRATDIDQVLAQHQRLTLVPDAIGDGTNCIISTPPNLIRYQFDGHSFKPHVEAAYAIDTAPQIVRNENFALDIDTPLDLDELLDRSEPCQTRTYLETSGIASRLRQPHNGPNAL
jgi:2-phospho-L-lactate guanylyltransferase